MKSLSPYRRFNFRNAGYNRRANSRIGGIELMRSWWAGVK
jgi:hypothetical protein